MTFSGLSQDFHRTFWRLSAYFFMIFLRLSEDFPRTFWGLYEDFLRTFLELSQDFLRTFQDFFKTFSGFLKVFLRIPQDFLMTFSRSSRDFLRIFLRTILGLSQEFIRTITGFSCLTPRAWYWLLCLVLYFLHPHQYGCYPTKLTGPWLVMVEHFPQYVPVPPPTGGLGVLQPGAQWIHVGLPVCVWQNLACFCVLHVYLEAFSVSFK